MTISHENMEICLQLWEQARNMGRRYQNIDVGDARQNYHAQVVIRVEINFAIPKYWENCSTPSLVSLHLREHWRDF